MDEIAQSEFPNSSAMNDDVDDEPTETETPRNENDKKNKTKYRKPTLHLQMA